ncbi:MiaB/RimO family radical SAM methylthiotransferase [candidate division WOR-3 bacterium]|nr:MiaB/RimO family radical SAM methylthiotransferase [candidate division WOR-3 bacterium]
MKVNLISLGCPKNLVDSERILGRLGGAGMTVCAAPGESDIIILNTCGFIAPAIAETEQEIEKNLGFVNNGRRLYVIGCAVNRCGTQLKRKYPRVSGWFRLEDVPGLLDRLASGDAIPGVRLPTTIGYAYLKISDGCSNLCSYCTIPSIKGPHRSSRIEDLIAEGQGLAALGIKELILIGQDTTRYGIDLYGKPMISTLLDELSRISGVEWLRIMYAHPGTIDGQLIDTIARNKKVCKYIDLPIQHINSRLLDSMNRRVDRQRIERVIKELNEIDGIAIRTTVIVGYPTETDAEFDELMEFCGEGYFDWLGVFPYYRERGTEASGLRQLPEETIRRRYAKALALQQYLLKEKNRRRCGITYRALIHGRGAIATGHAGWSAPECDSQILVEDQTLVPGEFYHIRISRVAGSDLRGEMASLIGRSN